MFIYVLNSIYSAMVGLRVPYRESVYEVVDDIGDSTEKYLGELILKNDYAHIKQTELR